MKICLIGSTGQLGSDILKVFEKKHKVVHGGRDLFDVSKIQDVDKFIKGNFDAVINCSAFLDVPLAEKSIRESLIMNSIAPMHIADACARHKIKFIHFSTDYVFDGKKKKPYIETDKCNPLNIYGFSKYIGEEGILSVNPKSAIMRVSGLYGKTLSKAKGYNFISLFLKRASELTKVDVVCDEVLTPTYTLNAAKQTNLVFENDICGIIHSTDEGEVSWYDFACEIKKQLKLKVKVIKKRQEKSSVERPKYSVLENKKLKDAKLNIMKDWKESLTEFLEEVYI